MREEQLVLLIQKVAAAEDAEVEFVGRHDEAIAAPVASGDADEDRGSTHDLRTAGRDLKHPEPAYPHPTHYHTRIALKTQFGRPAQA